MNPFDIMPPEEVVEKMAKAGIIISERALREKAKRLGCYRKLGRAIGFYPTDIEKLMEPDECSNQSKGRTVHTTQREARSTGGRSKGQRASRSAEGYQTPAPSANASKPKSEPVTPIPFRKKD